MQDLTTVIGSTVLWAGLATALVMIPGVALAYALARHRFPGHALLSAVTGLPLVLPPTAVGYLLLRLLADDGLLGRETLGFDLGIILTWRGVVLACALMSLPLVVRTARVSFEAVNPRLEQMARTLGHGRWRTFRTVTMPLAGRGLAAAAILGFTRAMGEFGATIVVAGNIPGRTQTLSTAIYRAQQAGEEARADGLVLVALLLGASAILAAEWLSRPRRDASPGGRRP
jgi:molybdate transport system permease protein